MKMVIGMAQEVKAQSEKKNEGEERKAYPRRSVGSGSLRTTVLASRKSYVIYHLASVGTLEAHP